MNEYSSNRLLFIRPKQLASTHPLIDGATRRMAAAFRQATAEDRSYMGCHTCKCGADSEANDFFLPNDKKVNSLCVHYLAFHRDEVPLDQLAEVERLQFGEVEPSDYELNGRIFEVKRDDIDTRNAKRRIREESFPEIAQLELGPKICSDDIDEIVRIGTKSKIRVKKKPWWQFWRSNE